MKQFAVSLPHERFGHFSRRAQQLLDARRGLPLSRTQHQAHQQDREQRKWQGHAESHSQAHAGIRQGDRTSISAPSSIATIPPMASTPWLVYFASRINNPRASTISTRPAGVTGKNLHRVQRQNQRDSADHSRGHGSRMREFGVQPQHTHDQQNKKRVGLHDARQEPFPQRHRNRLEPWIAQRQLRRGTVKTFDRAPVQFRQQVFRRVCQKVDQLSVQRFGFGPRFAVHYRRLRQFHVPSALGGVAAQKRGGVVQYFFLQRFIHLQRNASHGQ